MSLRRGFYRLCLAALLAAGAENPAEAGPVPLDVANGATMSAESNAGRDAALVGPIPSHLPQRGPSGSDLHEHMVRYLQLGCVARPSALYTVWSSGNAFLDGRFNPSDARKTAAARAATEPGAGLRGNVPPLWDARDSRSSARDPAERHDGLISACYADSTGDHPVLLLDDGNAPLDLFAERKSDEDEDEDDDSARRARTRSENRARLRAAATEDPELLDPAMRAMLKFLRSEDGDPGEWHAGTGSNASTTTIIGESGEAQPLGVVQTSIRWALHNPFKTALIVGLTALLLGAIARTPGPAQRAATSS